MKRGEDPDSGHRTPQDRIVTEQFQLFVDAVVDYAIIMLDPEGRISTWNRGAERMLGYTADEVLGKHVSILFTEQDRRRGHPEEELRIAAEQGRYEEEGSRVRKDGSVFPALVTITPVRDENDRLLGFAKVTQDLSEQESRERVARLLVDSSRILSESHDYEATVPKVVRLVVPTFADWCAVDVVEAGAIRRLATAHADPAREGLVRELAHYFSPEARAVIDVPRVIETGRPELLPEIPDSRLLETARDDEYLRLLRQLRPRSAMIVPLVTRGRVLGALTLVAAESGRRFDEEDLPFAVALADRIAVSIDVARLLSEAVQGRGEAERRARQEFALRKALEAVSASFTVSSVIREIAEGAVLATNADGTAVERIHFGRGEVEVVAVAGELKFPLGRRLRYHGSLAQRVTERAEPLLIPNLAETTEPVPAYWRETCGDCSLLVLPLLDSGEAIGALILLRKPEKMIFRDDELERASSFAYLAALAFRKIRLLEEPERRRRELLEVMESRSRLMRGFSHDVKNPIGAAAGMLDLLKDGALGDLEPKQRDAMERARRALASALRLIDDLLELARAEAGEIDIRLESVDLRQLAHEMVEEYRAPAEAKGLEIEARFPEEIPVIESDSGRIRQILGNLLSNAVKYTERGRITVRVEVREDGAAPRAGRWLAIDVSDTGPGIPKDKQKLLFQEFKRIEPSAGRGTGLGLAISRGIALALHGDITVHSEPGRGSTFTLWLPMGREAQAERRAATAD
ncbi:MAG TPA: ATP-binding protein [Longimicrobiales bacterium]